jgi:phosphate uptake regulator
MRPAAAARSVCAGTQTHAAAPLARDGRDPGAVHDGLRLRAMARYIERMGDHATNLAEMVIFMVEGRDVRHPGRLDDRRPLN